MSFIPNLSSLRKAEWTVLSWETRSPSASRINLFGRWFILEGIYCFHRQKKKEKGKEKRERNSDFFIDRQRISKRIILNIDNKISIFANFSTNLKIFNSSNFANSLLTTPFLTSKVSIIKLYVNVYFKLTIKIHFHQRFQNLICKTSRIISLNNPNLITKIYCNVYIAYNWKL